MRLALLFLLGCPGGQHEVVPRKVTLVEAPQTDDVAALVRAQPTDERLVVYVGASWCEPCTRFHDAAARGELDTQLGGTRFLIFDRDRDAQALDAAGYRSSYIPLFALANPDGTRAKAIEGGIKGDGAVGQLVPRLRALLDGR